VERGNLIARASGFADAARSPPPICKRCIHRRGIGTVASVSALIRSVSKTHQRRGRDVESRPRHRNIDMRVTQATTYLNFLRDLQLAQERTEQAQERVTTGKRFVRPSEDPGAASDVVRLSAENAEAVQFQSNLASASSRLQAADSALDGVENMVQR